VRVIQDLKPTINISKLWRRALEGKVGEGQNNIY